MAQGMAIMLPRNYLTDLAVDLMHPAKGQGWVALEARLGNSPAPVSLLQSEMFDPKACVWLRQHEAKLVDVFFRMCDRHARPRLGLLVVETYDLKQPSIRRGRRLEHQDGDLFSLRNLHGRRAECRECVLERIHVFTFAHRRSPIVRSLPIPGCLVSSAPGRRPGSA